jgi:hypothetical protein
MDKFFNSVFRLTSIKVFEQRMLELEYSITEVEYSLWILH